MDALVCATFPTSAVRSLLWSIMHVASGTNPCCRWALAGRLGGPTVTVWPAVQVPAPSRVRDSERATPDYARIVAGPRSCRLAARGGRSHFHC